MWPQPRAELVAVDDGHLTAPPRVPWAVAGALFVAGATAYTAVQGRVPEGDGRRLRRRRRRRGDHRRAAGPPRRSDDRARQRAPPRLAGRPRHRVGGLRRRRQRIREYAVGGGLDDFIDTFGGAYADLAVSRALPPTHRHDCRLRRRTALRRQDQRQHGTIDFGLSRYLPDNRTRTTGTPRGGSHDRERDGSLDPVQRSHRPQRPPHNNGHWAVRTFPTLDQAAAYGRHGGSPPPPSLRFRLRPPAAAPGLRLPLRFGLRLRPPREEAPRIEGASPTSAVTSARSDLSGPSRPARGGVTC